MSAVATSFLGRIDVGGRRFRFDLQWNPRSHDTYKIFELTNAGRKKALACARTEFARMLERQPGLDPVRVRLLLPQLERIVQQGQAKPYQLPDPSTADVPEAPFRLSGIGSAAFRFVEGALPQNRIRFETAPPPPSSSRNDLIRRETRLQGERMGVAYNPSKHWNPKRFWKMSHGPTRESFLGISNSIVPRKAYEMELTPEGSLSSFFCRTKPFLSREIFAYNSSLNGAQFAEGGKVKTVERAISSSFNRFAQEPSMMRMVQAEDGTGDVYAGRVDTKGRTKTSKAKQMVQFLFLSEHALGKKGKGILPLNREKKTYQLQFAVQSLLDMYGKEAKLFEDERKAYQLLQEEGPLTIDDPSDPDHPFTVYLDPIPIAANPLNSSNQLAKLLPDTVSGAQEAREASAQGDQVLFQRAESLLPYLSGGLRKEILDAIDLLKEGSLHSWQTVMTRAHLCRLLGLPLIVHCLSSVDRTNIANAAISAMNQWIRSGKPIPVDEKGRAAVHLMPTIRDTLPDGTSYSPFKKLFAFNLLKGMKVAEYSRGAKGFKFERGILQNPALKDLLPDEYLTLSNPPLWKQALQKCAALGLAIVAFLGAIFLIPSACKKYGIVGLSTPFIACAKTFHNGREVFFPAASVNEDHPDLKNRHLIH
jgi:hypothetical protein